MIRNHLHVFCAVLRLVCAAHRTCHAQLAFVRVVKHRARMARLDLIWSSARLMGVHHALLVAMRSQGTHRAADQSQGRCTAACIQMHRLTRRWATHLGGGARCRKFSRFLSMSLWVGKLARRHATANFRFGVYRQVLEAKVTCESKPAACPVLLARQPAVHCHHRCQVVVAH